MNSISVCLLLLGICCLITGEWSDWRCKEQGGVCFMSRTCTPTAKFNCSKTSEVTVRDCPCVSNTSEHRGGWSDWSCKKQGEFCFKSRTCNSTAGFNCSKTSEVTVTNCPCVAEWSPWGGWTCHTDQSVCLKLRKRTCISGFKGNDCLNLQGKDYEQTFCDKSCNDSDTISEHKGGWSDWGCKKQGDFCFKSRTCNSTAAFNCSKTSEVTVTNCPCAAEWSPWGGWTCHTDQSVCLKLRKRTCISGFKGNDCLNLQGKDYEQTFCDKSCNDSDTISEHKDDGRIGL
ncbi:A disintegrin and metalloproteinase with thrombospondin motifs adt-2-like [Ruditapes philippinarum]|uniref:A disintegrin and metalloproteinase with thrombospondin motifs adt-2-like n=1 Tax=Ruditapes philippinarum TaxID=129788 RepID=UPI00295B7862|nr:A disintegrin and metalloproteinase with thrombospondin motifs adt-2-like [Ruditapes philippinarum]